MADEPTLPQLPAVSWDERSQSISTRSRKRARLDQSATPPMFATSSDPAFFSSDDDPAVENYTQARRKKRLVGSWYEQQPVPSSDSAFGDEVIPQPKPNRKFARHFDSGVYMAETGDDTGVDDDICQTGAPYPPRARLPQLNRRPGPKLTDAEATMRRVIQKCIDDGDEVVDISGLQLESITSETVEMISELAPIPIVAEDVPFEQREPNIKLFIANSELTTVPGALFRLEHLASLSLRGNRLEELPDSIGNLKNLRELNVARNRLRYLPSSLLKLLGPGSKLTSLSIQLNNFPEADPSLLSEARVFDAEFQSPSIVSAYFVGRSSVRYLRWTAESLRFEDASPPNAKITGRAGDATVQDHDQGVASASRVPSLVELALRKCYQSSMLHQFPDYLPDDSFEHLRTLFRRLISQREAGGVHCSTCGTPLGTPAIQWLEWWGIKHDNVPGTSSQEVRHDPDVVPFLFTGCSAACGPRDISPGTSLEDLEDAPVKGSGFSRV